MANKTFDSLGLIVEDAAVTTTASCTGVNINGLSVGSAEYVAVLTYGATTGTVDGSNYYTLQLEVSDAIGGTYKAVGDAVHINIVAILQRKRAEVGFGNGTQLLLVVAATG